MARWRDGEMARWRDGEMARWQDGELHKEWNYASNGRVNIAWNPSKWHFKQSVFHSRWSRG
jgi:hypothetical protein